MSNKVRLTYLAASVLLPFYGFNAVTQSNCSKN